MIAAGVMHEDARELGMAMGTMDSCIGDEKLLSKLTAATAELTLEPAVACTSIRSPISSRCKICSLVVGA